MVKRREIDFTTGRMLKKIIIYALPIVGVNVLQLLFTTADIVVLGMFTNDDAVAAVGATTQIINLTIGFFMGLSVGANVLVARYLGAHDKDKVRRLVGTATFVSIVFGLIIMAGGVLLAEQLLLWTNCDPLVLPYATTYLRIYFLGMPVIMVYNFSAAILRAVGDTLRPLIFLIIGGIVNVALNIFLVTVVGLDIEGVAIATVTSNLISAVAAIYLLIKNNGYAKLERKHFRIYKQEFSEIFKIGLPMAISKCLFSFANVLVQSSLNALGNVAMTAHTITKEIDGFILEAVHGLGVANVAVISQNYGAKDMGRIKKAAFISCSFMSLVTIVLGVALLLVGRTLCSIMTDTELVLDYCMVRITTVSIFYILLGLLNVVQETIRGIGYSFTALMLSVCANIVLRLIYLLFIYPSICIVGDTAQNLRMLYLLYPASWFISLVIGFILLLFLYKRVKERIRLEKSQEQTALEVNG